MCVSERYEGWLGFWVGLGCIFQRAVGRVYMLFGTGAFFGRAGHVGFTIPSALEFLCNRYWGRDKGVVVVSGICRFWPTNIVILFGAAWIL